MQVFGYVIYWCPLCRMYHVDTVIEFHNAVPYHRSSTGELHKVEKSDTPYWMRN